MSFAGASSIWDCYTTPRAAYHPPTQTLHLPPFAPSPEAPALQVLSPPTLRAPLQAGEPSDDFLSIILLCILSISLFYIFGINRRFRSDRTRLSSKHPNSDPDLQRRRDTEPWTNSVRGSIGCIIGRIRWIRTLEMPVLCSWEAALRTAAICARWRAARELRQRRAPIIREPRSNREALITRRSGAIRGVAAGEGGDKRWKSFHVCGGAALSVRPSALHFAAQTPALRTRAPVSRRGADASNAPRRP